MSYQPDDDRTGTEMIPAARGNLPVPAAIIRAGPRAAEKFLEFFAARIANPNTRLAYARAVARYFAWCDEHELPLEHVKPVHVAAYIRIHPGSPPTVKQHLAAVRVLYDWLVVSQVVTSNPATSVKGPKLIIEKGKTPVLDGNEARRLLESINTGTLTGKRDHALFAVMLYSFARVSAAIRTRREDYYLQGIRPWLRLAEKGGKIREIPVHHEAAEALEAYLKAGGITEPNAPLFQTLEVPGRLSGAVLTRRHVLAVIKKRAKKAGLPPNVSCHTFRATGITAYLSNGGTLEHAQRIAGHASAKTTKLYDRTADTITVSEIERIIFK